LPNLQYPRSGFDDRKLGFEYWTGFQMPFKNLLGNQTIQPRKLVLDRLKTTQSRFFAWWLYILFIQKDVCQWLSTLCCGLPRVCFCHEIPRRRYKFSAQTILSLLITNFLRGYHCCTPWSPTCSRQQIWWRLFIGQVPHSQCSPWQNPKFLQNFGPKITHLKEIFLTNIFV
jgi:hypothetical protein